MGGCNDSWEECLDKYGVDLPTGYYFGLSAHTGELSGNFYQATFSVTFLKFIFL